MAAHAEPLPTSGRSEERESQLTPTLTRKMLLLFIVGDILGGGIYARTGEVAGEIGGAIWTGFALAGVIAAFTAASYAELVSKFPQAAGAALYIHKAFKAPLLTFIVAFAVMCSGVSSAAALATAFGGDYLSEFVELPTVLVALGVILVVSLINFRGIKESANFNLGCTLIELGGLFLVVLIGAAFLFDGGGDPARALEFKDDATPALLIDRRRVDRVLRADRLRGRGQRRRGDQGRDASPSRARCSWASGIAGAVYLLVTVIAGMAVPADTLADSDGPLLEVVTQGPLSVNSQVFSAIALFAIINGCLLNLVMASRLMYGMANERRRPRDPRHACTRAAGRRGWRSSSPPRSPPCWRSSATSRRSPTRPSCCCCSCSSAVHVSLLVLRRTPGRPRALPRADGAAVARRRDLRRARGPAGRRGPEARAVGRRAARCSG